jgi:hypothetical protein
VHDCGQAMCDKNSDALVLFDNPLMVSVMDSSVMESSAEVASSKMSNLGFLIMLLLLTIADVHRRITSFHSRPACCKFPDGTLQNVSEAQLF